MAIDPDVESLLDALNFRIAALEGLPLWPAVRPTGGDDTQMLLDKIAELEAGDGTGVLYLDGQFQTSGTLTIRNCHVAGSGAVLNSSANIAIQIGTPAVSCVNKRLDLPFIHDTDPAGNPEAVAVKVVAADSNVFTVGARRHHTPLLLAGDGAGVAYNTFTITELTGVRCLVIDPQNDGWVNQNTFIGGRYRGFDIDHERAIELRDNGTYEANNNVWVNPSIEGGPDFMLDVAASFNVFIAPRFEGESARVRFHGQARENLIFGGYDIRSVTVEEDVNYFNQGTNRVIGMQPEWIRNG